VIKLLPLFINIFDVVFNFYLLFSSLESIWEQKFAIESADLFCLLEELCVGFSKFLFLDLVLELLLLLINSSSFKLLLLKLSISLFLLPLFKVFEVICPLISALLTLLILIVGTILLVIAYIAVQLPDGIKLARIFILVSSSWVMVIAPFDDIQKLYFIY